MGDIEQNPTKSNRNLYKIRSNTDELRTQHLLQRASAIDIENEI